MPAQIIVMPGFLRQGRALEDARRPDRLVIGERDSPTGDAVENLFEGIDCPRLRCSLSEAEMIKCATNSVLATAIGLGNELANIAQRYAVDYDIVKQGLDLDPRINTSFMVPGAGFGGSCLPKDAAALVAGADKAGYRLLVLPAALKLNERQPKEVLTLLREELGSLRGRRIALLGLAFKGGIDDVRGSKAIDIGRLLVDAGTHVVGYDPRAAANFRGKVRGLRIARTIGSALSNADACVIQADWPEFRTFADGDLDRMKSRVIVDARRAVLRHKLPGSVRYRRIGSPP